MKQRLLRIILLILIITTPTLFAQGAQTVTHIVQPGETLAVIATRYAVDMDQIAATNGIENFNKIRSWQTLSIPNASAAAYSAPVSAAPSAQVVAPATGANVHVVQRGDTIFSIARKYGLSVDDLLSANGIEDPRFIHSGLQLNLRFSSAAPAPPPPEQPNPQAQAIAPAAPAPAPQPAQQPVNDGTRQQYIVRRGDFLTQLGIDLDTSWIALAKLNNLEAPYVLHVGSTLLLPERADVELYDPKYAAWKWFDIYAHQPGAQVGVGREIVILLDAQAIYAYENGALQNAVRVSTGKKATPTVKGDHKIWLKRRSQTMSGPGYRLDNVEWVMYFYRDYAIHGTWWHTNFGQPMSHGCVNLKNPDAQWFYEFASIGTPVHVR